LRRLDLMGSAELMGAVSEWGSVVIWVEWRLTGVRCCCCDWGRIGLVCEMCLVCA
jgi:hypothetical protein